MATFTKKIEIKYGVETFEQTKNTHDWILKSFNKYAKDKSKTTINFLFHIGDIYCSVDSIEEFIQAVVGSESVYSFTSLNINLYNGDETIYISVYLGEVGITTDNKGTLLQITKVLQETTLEEEKQTATTYIENQYNGNVVKGNDNIVVSNSEKVNINKDTKQEEKINESKFKKWLTAIGQNLLSNGIWYLLIAIGTAVITYFFTK